MSQDQELIAQSIKNCPLLK